MPALITMNEAVEKFALATPDKDFIIQAETDDHFSYADVDKMGRKWAGLLSELGVGREDTVAIMGAPGVEWVCAWMGAAWLGARATGINTQYVGEMLHYVLDNCAARVMLIDECLLPALESIESAWPKHLHHVIVLGKKLDIFLKDTCKIHEANTLLSQATVYTNVSVPSMDDIGCVTYTSGTTGRSKGVLMTWLHLRGYVMGGVPWDDVGSGVVMYNAFPMYHLAGLTSSYLAASNGGTVVFRKTWSTSEFWNDIDQHRVNTTFFVGGTSEFIKKLPPSENDGEHSLRSVLLTPLPADVKEFEERFNLKLWTFYGSTEIGAVTFSEESPRVRGTCGRARPGYDLKIVDDEMNEVSDGYVGELLVRADDPRTMLQGYLNLPDAEQSKWVDGWFRTGDMMRRDEDGNYYFIDRSDDVLRRRGENISSREVEIAVNKHPAVLESAVIGIPAEVAEDEVLALVELRDGQTLSEQELSEFLAEQLPRFMRPSVIRICDELPRTATGKVQKAQLRKEFRACAEMEK